MPAAATAKNTECDPCSCIIVVRANEGVIDYVTCFEFDADGAIKFAQAHTEDGDGTFTYSVKRLHNNRAIRMLSLDNQLRQAQTAGAREQVTALMVRLYEHNW